MLTLLVLPVIAPPLVTVSFAPLSLPKALERLSAAMGERLECSPALREEVLLVRLHDADPARVLREVAVSANARWETREGLRRLVPDPAAGVRRQAREKARRQEAVAAAVADLTRRLAAEPATLSEAEATAMRRRIEERIRQFRSAIQFGGPAAASAIYPTSEGTPGWRAGVRLLAALGPGVVANLRPGERVVYAERPTAVQRPFPSSAASIFAAYRAEQRAFAAAPAPDRVRLELRADDEGDGASAALLASTGASRPNRTGLRLDRPPARSLPVPTGEKPLVLPREAWEYLELVNVASASRRVRDSSFQDWRTRLLDPVANEPTGWMPGTALVAAADALDRNLIGTVSEAVIYRQMPYDPNVTPTGLLNALRDDVHEADGWLIAEPPTKPWRAPRSRAKTLLAQAVAQGGLALDAAAAWAGESRDPVLSESWLGVDLATILGSDADFDDDRTLLFWNALGNGPRAALRAGQPLRISTLPAAVKAELERMVYWEERANDPSDEGQTEPTDRFPNGLPDGLVTLKVTEQPTAWGWSSHGDEPVARTYLTGEYLGAQRARQARIGAVPETDRYRTGVFRTYEVRFDFGRGTGFRGLLHESFADESRRPLDRLPEAFDADVEKGRQRMDAILNRRPRNRVAP